MTLTDKLNQLIRLYEEACDRQEYNRANRIRQVITDTARKEPQEIKYDKPRIRKET